ncbi:MAG: phosphatase PAP2 family protein [Patescibacteria group bacterium]|nr:phosphatase PAP2 family protein [Patescibacteria group bacterium]
MNVLIIFGAKYILFVSAAIAVFYLLKQPRKRQKEILFFAVVVLPLSYIAAKIISRFYFDPRPFVVGNFTPLIPHKADNGFPSDHALLGAAIAFTIFRFDTKLGLFLLFLALLTGFARVFAGVHHLTDIAGSILIVLTVYSITILFRRSNLRNEKYAQKRVSGK